MKNCNQEKQNILIEDLCKRMFKKVPDVIDPNEVEALKENFDQMEDAAGKVFIESLRDGSAGIFNEWDEISKKCLKGRMLLNDTNISKETFEESKKLYQEVLELWKTIDRF